MLNVLFTGFQLTTEQNQTMNELSIQSQSDIATDGQSVSQSWCRAPLWDSWPDIYYCLTVTILLLWGALSDERTGLSSVQCSLSWVRVPWDSQPYFTVSDLRLPFSSPPTTRRVTVEVFDPASTRVSQWQLLLASSYIASDRTTAQKTHPFPSNGHMRTTYITMLQRFYCCVCVLWALSRNGYILLLVAYLLRASVPRRSLAMGVTCHDILNAQNGTVIPTNTSIGVKFCFISEDNTI
jgi:hypothetical protein